MALIFDGTNEKWGSYPQEGLIHRDIDHTFALFFKPNSGSTTLQWLGGMNGGPAAGNYRASGFFYRADQGTKNVSLFKASLDTYYNIAVPSENSWNVVIEARPSSGGLNVETSTKLALNATDVTTNTGMNTYSGDVTRFIVGSVRNVNLTPNYNNRFSGKIWGWAIWNRILSDSEINSLQAGAHPNTIATGLVDLHYFESVSAGLTTSVSQVGGRTMTFTGSPASDADSPFSAQDITSVNGGAGVTPGQVNSVNITGFTQAPNAGTFLGKALTTFGGNTTTSTNVMPYYADGVTYPDPTSSGSYTLSVNAETATENNVPLNLPAGHSVVTMSGLVTGNSRYIPYHVPDLTNNQKIVYPNNSGAFEVYADGGVRATNTGTYLCWRWDNVSTVMTQLNITVLDAEGGEIIVVTGEVNPTFEGGRLEAKESIAKFRTKLPFQPQSVAADLTTLRNDFNALISKMTNNGWFEGGEEQLTMLKISLQCGLPQLVKRLKEQAPDQMPVQSASVAADVAALRTDLNALLTKLKNANLMATS